MKNPSKILYFPLKNNKPMSKTIREQLEEQLLKVKNQIEIKGDANKDDVEKVKLWEAMLGVHNEATRIKSAKKIG